MWVEMTWTENELTVNRYTAEVEVPDEFDSWDDDAKREFLNDQRAEMDYADLTPELVDSDVVDSNVEGWKVG